VSGLALPPFFSPEQVGLPEESSLAFATELSMHSRIWACLVTPLALLLAVGCGPNNPNAPASFSGKVIYKNAPVRGGTVTFHTQKGAAYNGAIDAEGNYVAREIPTGEMTVTIETESINPNKKIPEYAGKKMLGPIPKDATKGAGVYVPIPKKYADKKKSGLVVKAEPGENSKDFVLTD